MATLSQLKVLNDSAEHEKMLTKLPRHIQEKWLRFIDRLIHGPESAHANLATDTAHDDYPPFCELCKFISQEAHVACSPFKLMFDDSKKEDIKPPRPFKSSVVRSYGTQADEFSSNPTPRDAHKGSGLQT